MNNKNFFEQLDDKWEDTLTNIYKDTFNSYTFTFKPGNNIYKFKTEDERKSFAYETIRATDEILEPLQRITFLNIDTDFRIDKNWKTDVESYTIKTKFKNVLINGMSLNDIFFSDSKINKKYNKLNLVAGSTAYMKYYDDFQDTMLDFNILIYKNDNIALTSNIFSTLYYLDIDEELLHVINKARQKYEK